MPGGRAVVLKKGAWASLSRKANWRNTLSQGPPQGLPYMRLRAWPLGPSQSIVDMVPAPAPYTREKPALIRCAGPRRPGQGRAPGGRPARCHFSQVQGAQGVPPGRPLAESAGDGEAVLGVFSALADWCDTSPRGRSVADPHAPPGPAAGASPVCQLRRARQARGAEGGPS